MGPAERDSCAALRALTALATPTAVGTTAGSSPLIVDLEPRGARAWRFVMANGTKVHVEARQAQEWLELRAVLPDPEDLDGARLWALLRQNAHFAGSARAALGLDDDRLHARAEVWMADERSLDARVAAAATALSSACHALVTLSISSASPPSVDESASTRLADFCRETGWAFSARADGVEVPLDGASSSRRARVSVMSDESVRAVVDLADATSDSSLSSVAIACALLRVAAVVRSVKGVAFARDDGRQRVGLVVVSDHPHEAAALDRALSALATARRLVEREVQALGDQRLARRYLARCVAPVPATPLLS